MELIDRLISQNLQMIEDHYLDLGACTDPCIISSLLGSVALCEANLTALRFHKASMAQEPVCYTHESCLAPHAAAIQTSLKYHPSFTIPLYRRPEITP